MGVVPAAPNTRFLLDQYDASGFINAGQQSWDSEIIESGNFATAAKTETASGKHTEKASETILFDCAAGAASIDAIMDTVAKGGDVAHYRGRSWGGHQEGHPIYETIEVLATKPLTAAEGQMLLMQGTWQQAGPTSRSKILRYAPATAPITATGNGTGFTQGAIVTTTAIYQAVIRVLGGVFSSIQIQIHQSNDNGGTDPYTLLTGMTHTFSAPGVARVTFTGAAKAWKRVRINAFSGTNALVVVTGGQVHGT